MDIEEIVIGLAIIGGIYFVVKKATSAGVDQSQVGQTVNQATTAAGDVSDWLQNTANNIVDYGDLIF